MYFQTSFLNCLSYHIVLFLNALYNYHLYFYLYSIWFFFVLNLRPFSYFDLCQILFEKSLFLSLWTYYQKILILALLHFYLCQDLVYLFQNFRFDFSAYLTFWYWIPFSSLIHILSFLTCYQAWISFYHKL